MAGNEVDDVRRLIRLLGFGGEPAAERVEVVPGPFAFVRADSNGAPVTGKGLRGRRRARSRWCGCGQLLKDELIGLLVRGAPGDDDAQLRVDRDGPVARFLLGALERKCATLAIANPEVAYGVDACTRQCGN